MANNCDHYFLSDGKRINLWKMIKDHEEWIRSGHEFGKCLDLSNKSIVGVTFPRNCNLTNAVFKNTDFYSVVIHDVRFASCDMEGVSFKHCDITHSQFASSDMTSSYFYNTSVSRCSFDSADLTNSKLVSVTFWNVTFYEACLENVRLENHHMIDVYFNYGTKHIPINIPMACPSEGSFIGWKVARDMHNPVYYLIKLQIPASAKRSSATTRKCRCDKAKVVGIYNLTGVKARKQMVVNYAYDTETVYEVGKMVYPNSFDPNRWEECSCGIHFFINKQDAIDYAMF